jgi:hypothetical protein
VAAAEWRKERRCTDVREKAEMKKYISVPN